LRNDATTVAAASANPGGIPRNWQEIVKEIIRTSSLVTASARTITIPPPTHFAPRDTIIPGDSARLSLVRSLFPNRTKISGTNKGEIGVDELLSHLKFSQDSIVLSEPEFLVKLLECFSGGYWQMISEWIAAGFNTNEIYIRIMRRMYKGESPQDAKQKLTTFNNDHSYRTLAAVEGEVTRLARIASYRFLPGVQRDAFFNMIATDTLLGTLPRQIQIILMASIDHHVGLSAKDLPFATICDLTAQHATEINRFLGERANKMKKDTSGGSSSVAKSNGKKNQRGNDAMGQVHVVAATTGSSNGGTDSSSRGSSSSSRGRGGSRGGSSRGSSRGGRGVGATSSSTGTSNRTNAPPRDGATVCEFCPSRGHSYQTCPWVEPSKRHLAAETCKKCWWEKRHPVCPLERANPGGYLAFKAEQAKKGGN